MQIYYEQSTYKLGQRFSRIIIITAVLFCNEILSGLNIAQVCVKLGEILITILSYHYLTSYSNIMLQLAFRHKEMRENIYHGYWS